jgi:hypothetical protein
LLRRTMKGGLSVAVSPIAVEGAGLALVPKTGNDISSASTTVVEACPTQRPGGTTAAFRPSVCPCRGGVSTGGCRGLH